MSASFLTSPSCSPRLLLCALLSSGFTSSQLAQATDDAVQVSCPERPLEEVFEIEARVRASLLTGGLTATVSITCQATSAGIRIDSATDGVVVDTATSPLSFRDDILRAVEQALQTLRARAREATLPDDVGVSDPSPALPRLTPTPTAAPTTNPSATSAVAARPPTSVPPPTALPPIELFAAVLFESWRDQPAVGGALGVGVGRSALFYALRVGVLRPLAQPERFSAVEGQLELELGIEPRFAAGMRVALGLGPSVLFIAPHGELMARTGTAKRALFATAHLSRPFWFGRVALVPRLGMRLFTGERGVRIDSNEQWTLGVLAPQFGLELAYGVD